MHIKFKDIELHNFMSFGDAKLSLETCGFTLVSGINNRLEDNSKSNGSGKSSIWEAIIWSLVGETMRGSSNIVNMYAEDGCWVKLKFSVNSDNYEILRSKDSKEYKTNLKIIVNGEDKSGKGIKDSSKILFDMLPDLTSSLLGSVIVLGQGLPLRFTNNTPAGRKEMLEKLSKSDFMIDDLKERIANRKSLLNDEIRCREDDILKAVTQQQMVNNQLKSYLDELNSLKNIDAIKYDIDTTRSKLNKLNSKLSSINIDVDECNALVMSISSEKFDLTSKRTTTLDTELVDLKLQLFDIDSKISEYLTKKSLCESEIKRIESISDICPTCGQKLLGVEKPSTESLEANLLELSNTLAGLNVSRCSIAESIENKTRDINNQFDNKLKELDISYNNCTVKLNELNNTSKLLQNEVQQTQIKLTELLNMENTYNFNNDRLKKAVNESEKALSELSEKIMYISIDRDKLNESLNIVNKMSTIITRDFRGYLLSNVIDYIDLKVKEYAFEVFGTDLTKFTLEGNNINIYYDGKIYENLSGGERQKIDLIIQFAIRDMLCKFLNFSSNIIVLDEIFDNLDAVGSCKVLNLITNKLTDVDNIFIVTHHAADLHIPYDSEIVVAKNNNGFSEII
jgi:DNA repair exonuclease SbcCD ATPase subunit